MIQVQNNSSKQITFPALSFSIGPKETKEITDDMSSHVLSYPDISKAEKKIDIDKVERKENVAKDDKIEKHREIFKTKQNYKK